MTIEVIDNHSIRTDLLPEKGGNILDVGARGFRFSKWFTEKGHFSVALDPSPEVEEPKIPGLIFYPTALVAPWQKKIKWQLNMVGNNPEAFFLEIAARDESKVQEISTVDMLDITPKGMVWDVVKLNIEGSEYDVLTTWPAPIAKQITVSFHQHTARRWPESQIDYLVRRLSEWYVPVRHVKDARYCAGENWWDSLFVLKGIA